MIKIKSVYRLLLRLYPRRFYNDYAEEMEAVFASSLQAARQRGKFLWLCILLRELAHFPLELMRQYAYERSRNRASTMSISLKPSRIRFVRWLARLVGLLTALFYLDVLLRYLPNNPQVIPLFAAFILTVMSVLCAWRWERIGGITTILCSLLIALAGGYATYAYQSSHGDVIIWALVLAGVLWGLPFLIIGGLFIKFDQAAQTARR